MEQRLSLVTLGVGSLDVSRAFYGSLGWRPSPVSQDDVVFFQLAGMALALYPRHLLAQDAGFAAETEGSQALFCGITLAHNCRSTLAVDETFALALAAGAKAVKPPQAVFWGGYSGYFADPDNYLWEIAYNPHFPLDATGALRLSS